MADLDYDKGHRKVWVVRVPPYVAKQWREAIAASADTEVDEDTIQEATLGHLTLEGGNPTTLKVKGPDGEEQVLYMNASRDTSTHTNILSYEPAPDGTLQAPRVEGTVTKRFDAGPVNLDAAGGMSLQPAQVDTSYLAKTRARLAAAKQPSQKRKLQMVEDETEMMKLAAHDRGGDHGLYQPKQYKQTRQERRAAQAVTTRKHEKLTKDELEERLFNLFGQQAHWHFTQIQKTLDQAVASIKEVLIQIADQVKRGPNKDLWELKPQYKKAARAQVAAAAAAAAGGGG